MSDAAESDVPTDSTTNNSGITTSSLKSTLTEKLEAEHVDVEDISGTTKSSALYSQHVRNTHYVSNAAQSSCLFIQFRNN